VLRSSDHRNKKKAAATCGVITDSFASWLVASVPHAKTWQMVREGFVIPRHRSVQSLLFCEPQRIDFDFIGRDPIWKGEFRRVTPYCMYARIPIPYSTNLLTRCDPGPGSVAVCAAASLGVKLHEPHEADAFVGATSCRGYHEVVSLCLGAASQSK